MPGTRAGQRAALSTIVLTCAFSAPAVAQDSASTTVVRTSGDHLYAGFESFGDCTQRSMFLSAESSLSRTRVDGTRSVGEVNRTTVNMSDYNSCTASYTSFSVEWPDLNGVTWDLQTGTARMSLSRPVEVQRCKWTEETGQACETRSEILAIQIVWTGTGNFEDSVFVHKETYTGTYRKERTRSRVLQLSSVYDIRLNGQEITASSTFGDLSTQRLGTLTTGPL